MTFLFAESTSVSLKFACFKIMIFTFSTMETPTLAFTSLRLELPLSFLLSYALVDLTLAFLRFYLIYLEQLFGLSQSCFLCLSYLQHLWKCLSSFLFAQSVSNWARFHSDNEFIQSS